MTIEVTKCMDEIGVPRCPFCKETDRSPLAPYECYFMGPMPHTLTIAFDFIPEDCPLKKEPITIKI